MNSDGIPHVNQNQPFDFWDEENQCYVRVSDAYIGAAAELKSATRAGNEQVAVR